MTHSIVEDLSPKACLETLTRATVGRVGISIGALPVILPVNFMVLGESVLFRTAADSDLLRASVDEVVAFEADGYEKDGAFGWSVLIRGIGTEITEQSEIELARSLWLESWPLGERADHFVVIDASLISGRRFIRVP